MHSFVLYHRHAAGDCPAAFAAWNGFHSPLRGRSTISTCAHGGHEIWWLVSASDGRSAVRQLPAFVAERTVSIKVADVEIP
jgi:hypothetical protein